MEKLLSCELPMYHSLKSSVPALISVLLHPCIMSHTFSDTLTQITHLTQTHHGHCNSQL